VSSPKSSGPAKGGGGKAAQSSGAATSVSC
jgi:hypothetical protein